MKMKLKAQHLQPGDIVGSGEYCCGVTINSTQWPSNKVCVTLAKPNGDPNMADVRSILWGKYTMINVERKEQDEASSM